MQELQTFADWLRERDRSYIVRLLEHRADLSVPRPSDLTSLAARASTRASVQRVVDRLNRPQLQVLTAATWLAGKQLPVSAASLAAEVADGPGPLDAVARHVAALRERGLLWAGDEALRVQPTLAEVLGPVVAGVGPPMGERLSPAESALVAASLGVPDLDSAAHLLADAAGLAGVLARLPAESAEVVGKLAAAGPAGRFTRDIPLRPAASASGPLEQLVAHGILLRQPPDLLVLGEEATRGARGGRLYRELEETPPPLPDAPAHGSPESLDRLAAGSIFDVLRQLDDLCALIDARPPARLRTGGIGMRELRRLSADLGLDEAAGARLIELAFVSGFIGPSDREDAEWLPSTGYQRWQEQPPARQWVHISRAWLSSSRVASLVGTRDEKGGMRTALNPHLDRAGLVFARDAAFRLFLEAPEGRFLDAGAARGQLNWRSPRAAAGTDRFLDSVVADALWLGLLAGSPLRAHPGGALPSFARALLEGDDAGAEAVLAGLLPEPLTQVLLQADLTAVAPGPLTAQVRETLATFAKVEGRGHGTVFRFSDASIKAGLSRGWEVEDALAYLAEHSSTPMPQPLEYLIRDVARRFGRLRLGSARSYLRSDQPALLDELLAQNDSPALLGIRFRRLAPTVVVSSLDPQQLDEALQAIGMAVVTEADDGRVLVHRQEKIRVEVEAPRPIRSASLRLEPERAAELADMLLAARPRRRAADREADGNRESPRIVEEPAAALALLREAASTGRLVWVRVAGPQGGSQHILVQPLSVIAGRLRARDVQTSQEITVVAHRLSQVSLAPEEEPVPESPAPEKARAPKNAPPPKNAASSKT